MTDHDAAPDITELFQQAQTTMPRIDPGIVVRVAEAGDRIRRRRRRQTLATALASCALVASGTTYAATALLHDGAASEQAARRAPAHEGFGVPADEMAQTLATLLQGPVTGETDGVIPAWYASAVKQAGYGADLLARSQLRAGVLTHGTGTSTSQITIAVARPPASAVRQIVQRLCSAPAVASTSCTETHGGRLIVTERQASDALTRVVSYLGDDGWLVQTAARGELSYPLQGLTVIALSPRWLR